MIKQIPLNKIEYMMLEEVAKKHRQKPDQYIKNLIKSQYDSLKR